MEVPLLYILFLIVFALFLINLFTTKSSHKYKNLPPSPPCLPIIGHLHLLRQPVHRTLQSLSAKYGKIQLLRWGSRRVLLVTSPSIAEECFTKHDILFSNRPLLVAGKHFHYNYTTVVMAPYGDHWRNLRRIMSLEFFSSSRLAMFSSIRQREVRLLLDHVLKSCLGKTITKIELKSKLTDVSFNAMTMMILGKRYHGKDAGDAEDVKQFREMLTEVIELNAATNMVDFLPFLQWIDVSRMEKKMANLMAKTDSFLQVLVSVRRKVLSSNCDQYNGGEVRKLLIDNLLLMQQAEPLLYTDEVIKGLILVLVAGIETGAVAMEWAMSLLLNHPDKLDQVRAEIDTKVGQERMLDEHDLPNLNYLQNVINETLRLYPPFPLLGVRETSEDCVVDGFDVPCGTMMMINAWAIHRDPELWDEPTQFKPERFEGCNTGEGSGGNRPLIPFGGGRRGCPGAGLANRMIGLAVGSLIQAFEWGRISEEMVDMAEGLGLTLPKIKPLEAFCKPRPLMQRLQCGT